MEDEGIDLILKKAMERYGPISVINTTHSEWFCIGFQNGILTMTRKTEFENTENISERISYAMCDGPITGITWHGNKDDLLVSNGTGILLLYRSCSENGFVLPVRIPLPGNDAIVHLSTSPPLPLVR